MLSLALEAGGRENNHFHVRQCDTVDTGLDGESGPNWSRNQLSDGQWHLLIPASMSSSVVCAGWPMDRYKQTFFLSSLNFPFLSVSYEELNRKGKALLGGGPTHCHVLFPMFLCTLPILSSLQWPRQYLCGAGRPHGKHFQNSWIMYSLSFRIPALCFNSRNLWTEVGNC